MPTAELRSPESLEDEEASELAAANAAEEREEHDAAEEHSTRAARLRERIEGLKAEAGDATDPRDPAAEAEAASAQDDAQAALTPEEIIVRGLEIPYADMGGKRPSGASLTLSGAKALLEVETTLPKGTTITFTGIAVVESVTQKDKHDKVTQQVSEAEQLHVARVLDFEIEVPEE